MISKEKAVMDWIEENFDLEYFTIIDFPLFPAGKRLIARNGKEMLVYYNLLYDRVDWEFPEK